MSIENSQRGSVLVYALIIVGILLAINFSLLSIFLPKLRTVRTAVSTVSAIFAADSVLEWCIYESRTGDIQPPTMEKGATYRIEHSSNGQYYDSTGAGNSNICPLNATLDHRTRGTFSGVSRSFEVGEATTP